MDSCAQQRLLAVVAGVGGLMLILWISSIVFDLPSESRSSAESKPIESAAGVGGAIEVTTGKSSQRIRLGPRDPKFELRRLERDKSNFNSEVYERVTPSSGGRYVVNSMDHRIVQFWGRDLLSSDGEKRERAFSVFISASIYTNSRHEDLRYIDRIGEFGYQYLEGDAKQVGGLLFFSMQQFENASVVYSSGLAPDRLAAGKPYCGSGILPAEYPNDWLTRSVIEVFIERMQVPAFRDDSLNILNLLTYNLHRDESPEWWAQEYLALETGPIEADPEQYQTGEALPTRAGD